MIPLSDFEKVQLMVAKILSVEDIPKRDKLYKIIVDLGNEKRQLVSGLKGFYSKEELVGKKIIIAANLEFAKFSGIESQGMLLAAKNMDGKYMVIEADESIPEGTIVE